MKRYYGSTEVTGTDLSAKLSALSHPARIEILRHLSCHECCSCKDVVGQLELAQSTVSQHLKILVEAGLVRCEPHKQRSHYSVDPAALESLSRSVAALLDTCCNGSRGTGNCFPS